MRRPASLAQLELPLASSPQAPAATLDLALNSEPTFNSDLDLNSDLNLEPARVCARCGWYCPVTAPCPVCARAPEPGP